MIKPTIYILLNGELNMSPGKAAAQSVHSAMMLGMNSHMDFMTDTKRSVIVLEAKNSDQIRNVEEYLANAGIDCEYYIDEGVNEVDAYSITALAAGPLESDDTEGRSIFEAFDLYNGNAVLNLSGWRDGALTFKNGTTIYDGKVFKKLQEAIHESDKP